MTEQTNLVPKRRFKEFSNNLAWEQHKVIDIAPLQRGFDLPVSEMEAGSYPVIMSNGIGAYHSKYKAKAPGVVTGRSGTIGNLTFVEADYWPHNTALWVTDFKGNDAKFIYYLYQKLDLKRYGTGSGVPTLNRNDVHDTKAGISSVAEQKQISRLFDSIDNLITLHQRKLEKMKALKSAYLSEMFPAEGECEPKRRFAGFTDAWEQRELGEVVQIKDSARVPNELWAKSGVRYLRSSDLENSGLDGELFISIGAYEDYKSKTGAPERGDVLFNSGGKIGLSLLKTDNAPVYVQGGAILYARTSQSKDVEGGYLNVYFSTHRMAKYIDISSAGGTIKHFTLKPAKAAPFIFPNVIEQRKISEFFTELDHLITLHQRKLEKLQNLKKAFLNEMFV